MTMSNAFISPFKIVSSTNDIKLPQGRWLALVDKKVKKKLGSVFLKNFAQVVYVQAGDSLKTVENFARWSKKIIQLEQKNGRFDGIVAVGGGSVGDFAGFVASTWRRGVRFIQIPTTHLSVVDSAFGGKTALNLVAKNQIGTFYPAEKVWIVRSLLSNDPRKVLEGFAEFFKVALLDGGLWKKLVRSTQQRDSFSAGEATNIFFNFLPQAISVKQKIVARDPRENRGIRKILNLGHTFGHVLELIGQMHHGEAVALGIRLEIEFNFLQGGNVKPLEIFRVWDKFFDRNELFQRSKYPWSSTQLRSLLVLDKKNSGKKIQLVTLNRPGATTIRDFTVEAILLFLRHAQ